MKYVKLFEDYIEKNITESYSAKSYKLTEEEYNYLLPVLKKKLYSSNNNYYFVGSHDDLDDMLDRLKGLYNYYDDYNKIINYKCFKFKSLEPFRNELGVSI